MLTPSGIGDGRIGPSETETSAIKGCEVCQKKDWVHIAGHKIQAR